MTFKISFSFTSILFIAFAFSLQAGDPVKFDFSSGELPESWTKPKGDWKAVDGVLHGDEIEADEHAAVLSIPAKHKDSEISFRVRTSGVHMFALSYNHPKGHLFRVAMSKGTVRVGMDKDKKDPASKAETLQSEKLASKSDEWVTVSCKVTGDKVEVKCGEVTLNGTHPGLSKPKTGFRFVVKGKGLQIDDIAYTTSG